MQRTISFALGNIHRWGKTKNRNELIDYARKLDIDGVEITFDRKDTVYATKVSAENKKWLKTLKYVSIHAPFNLIKRSDNEQEVIKQLDIIERLYHEINAQNVIIHPQNLPSLEILKKYDFFVSTENLPIRHRIGLLDMKKIMKKYPKIGFCLDVNHAYKWNKNETEKYVRSFKNKITQVHLSGTYRHQEHKSLKVVTKDFMKSIEPVIKELNVPIVIEEDFRNKDINLVKEEIKYVREIFVF